MITERGVLMQREGRGRMEWALIQGREGMKNEG